MANTNAAQKYYINTGIRDNARLFALQQIRPGEEIIAERPLDRIPIGLEDIYNPDQVLNTVKKYNASRHLDDARERMTEEDRDALDRLFNKDPKGGIASLWATNAFQFEEQRDGHSYTGLVLFNHISRANHSCRPNAVFTWNATRGVGTLYALDTIRARTEIKIEYTANTMDCLRTGVQRRKDFSKHWGFECQCGACFQQGESEDHRNKDDDKLRSRAAKRLNEIESEETSENESVAKTALRKLDLSKDYLETIIAIGIKDLKLANAYGMLAKWHEQAFDTATARVHLKDCDWCDGGHDKIIHLKEALSALDEENMVHIRCWGTEHVDLTHDDTKRQAIQVKKNWNM